MSIEGWWIVHTASKISPSYGFQYIITYTVVHFSPASLTTCKGTTWYHLHRWWGCVYCTRLILLETSHFAYLQHVMHIKLIIMEDQTCRSKGIKFPGLGSIKVSMQSLVLYVKKSPIVRPVSTMLRTVLITIAAALASKPASSQFQVWSRPFCKDPYFCIFTFLMLQESVKIPKKIGSCLRTFAGAIWNVSWGAKSGRYYVRWYLVR